jgi:anaerobic selenocysteine-containing dehydrogenase
MTNHWNDLSNADVMLALGGNPCENHPAAIAHIMEAKDKGAKLISVDRALHEHRPEPIFMPTFVQARI